MSEYDVATALHRLQRLGVDTSNLHQDYYKIPLENIDLAKVEASVPENKKIVSMRTHAMRCGVLLTFAYLRVYCLRHMFVRCAMCGVLESRTHGVELPEDFRSSFLAQRRVCEHRDVGTF